MISLLILQERKELKVDEKDLMNAWICKKQTSKASSSFVSSLPAAAGIDQTVFLGYEQLETNSKFWLYGKNKVGLMKLRRMKKFLLHVIRHHSMQRLVDK